MLFSEYSKKAKATAIYVNNTVKDLNASTLGLAYEAGSVLDIYSLYKNSKKKKWLREQIREELGDVLWYLINLARIFGISVTEILEKNLKTSVDVEGKLKGREKPISFARYKVDNMASYEKFVQKTDVRKNLDISVLGLVGEIGSITTINKKILIELGRNPATQARIKKFLALDNGKIRADAIKEIGDSLWYLTSIAQNFRPIISLADIAKNNLALTQYRWSRKGSAVIDNGRLQEERFPSSLRIRFIEKRNVTLMRCGKINIGDRLTDNAYKPDGYRYHDAFHLAYMAILGWSPVMRDLLKCKRKTEKRGKTDEVEDGARAAITEEAVAALIYEFADDYHAKFKNADRNTRVDDKILDMARRLTSNLEVKKCSLALWEKAILEGFKLFHKLNDNRGGTVEIDLKKQSLKYFPPTRT